jgi:hypothetical protein
MWRGQSNSPRRVIDGSIPVGVDIEILLSVGVKDSNCFLSSLYTKFKFLTSLCSFMKLKSLVLFKK